MRRRLLAYWLCQVFGWATWGVIGILYSVSAPGPTVEPWKYVMTYGMSVVVEISWTHAYRAVMRRGGWIALPPGRLLRRVVLASVVLGLVIPYTQVPIYYLIYPERFELLGRWLLPAAMSTTLSVLLWSAIYIAVHYFERWRQAEVDKLQLAVVAAEGQLHGLMAQLNPHFLFNCLNSVRALIVEDPAKAQAAVTALSSLMRYSLQRDATVPLATELEMVRTYLSLEQIRFDERLTSELAIADDAGAVPVPTMLVQGLVENGVKHGVEPLPGGGTIAIAAWRDGAALRVRVTSPGKIAPRAGSTRVGLANAHERLRLLYGERASLALREDGPGVIAELSLPLEAA
jgi:hypothetical protein